MAVNPFYVLSGGSNLNAGSTNSSSASVTSTNGNWDGTSLFIATGGTPFSAVTAGEWAAIYNDAASATPYIAQVTSLHLSGLGLNLSTTAKYGTAPATGATGKSAKVGGAWATPAHSLTFAGATAAYNATTQHIQQATYANTTSTITANITGSATAPVVINGFTSTPGDCDNDEQTSKPAITFTTGRMTISGSHVTYSNLSVTSANTANPTISITGTNVVIRRSSIENTNAAAASNAITNNGANNSLHSCYLKATTTATRVVLQSVNGEIRGCYIDGGISSIETNGGASVRVPISNCICNDPVSYGIHCNSAGAAHITFCSIYSAGVDGIRIATVPTNGSYISNCVFSGSATYDINNSSGANTNLVVISDNSHYNPGTAQTNGFGDYTIFGAKTETSEPFTNPGSADFSLVAAALSRNAASPTIFEGRSTTNYRDRGALQGALQGVFVRRVMQPYRDATSRIRVPAAVIAGVSTTTTTYVPLRQAQRLYGVPLRTTVRCNTIIPGVSTTTTSYIPLWVPPRQYDRKSVYVRRMPLLMHTQVQIVPLRAEIRMLDAPATIVHRPRTYVISSGTTTVTSYVPISQAQRLFERKIVQKQIVPSVLPGTTTTNYVPIARQGPQHVRPVYLNRFTPLVVPGPVTANYVPIRQAQRLFERVKVRTTLVPAPLSTVVINRPVIVTHNTIVR